jgi:GxxExxY protein
LVPGLGDATGVIIGCALEVHRTLGPEFPEIVYQRALALELQIADLEFDREVKVPIFYKSHRIDPRRRMR